jgi:RNA polymerase sigma-70 factor (ECF subfamily)
MRFRLWFGGRPDTAGRSRGGSHSGSDGASRAPARESLKETAKASPAILPADAETADRIARIQSGDTAAFDAMYSAYFERLWRFAYQYVRSREAAIDLVQDVLADVWIRREAWSPTSVSAYLFRAVRNRVVSMRRHDRTVETVHTLRGDTGDDIPPALGARLPSPDDAAASRDLDERLRRAIDGLTERQRAAVLLRWDQELNSVETAAVLGVSEAAVRKLLAHARERLQPLLDATREPGEAGAK